MDKVQLLEKEGQIRSKYQGFLDEVRMAFDRHCDEIKEGASKKFNAVSKDDEGGREKILDEEKAALDQTLLELKQLLNKKSAQVRVELEAVANLREQESFNLDDELEGL